MTQDKRGVTPFLLAAQLGQAEIMELLLEVGCDPSVPDNFNKGVMHCLAEKNLPDVMEFLLEEDKDMIQQVNLQVRSYHLASKNLHC